MGGHCSTEGRTFVGGPPEDFVTTEDVVRLVFRRWGMHVVSIMTYLLESQVYNNFILTRRMKQYRKPLSCIRLLGLPVVHLPLSTIVHGQWLKKLFLDACMRCSLAC